MMAKRNADTNEEGIAWEYRIWLTNRFLVWDLLRVMLLSIVISVLLVGITGLIFEQEFVTIPLVGWLAVIGTLVGLYFITILLLGLRYRAIFGVMPKGVTYQAGPKERRLLMATVAAGAAAGSPGTAGAGLLGLARDGEMTRWRDVHRVIVYRKHRAIVVRNSWRAVQRLWVPEELFEQVVSTIEEYWSAAGGQVDIVER